MNSSSFAAVVKSRRTRHVAAWVAILVAAFAALGFFAVPPIAKSKLEQGLSQALHRKVSVESVRFNPFVPSLTLRGFQVRDRDGEAVFAGFDELYVNAGWTSIVHLAPVVDEITLVKPQFRLVRNKDRSYNFQDLLDEFLARPKNDDPPPKFAVFNIRLVDGQVEFEDRMKGEKHALSEVRIGIPFISSLPAYAEVKVLPEVSARLNGAPFSLAGDTLPFAPSRTTHLSFDVDGFDLTRLTDYLPVEPRARLRSGLLDARLAIAFEQPEAKPPQVTLRGTTALRKLVLVERDDRPVIAWEKFGVELEQVEPLVPRIHLKRVEVDGADLRMRRDSTGALNLAQLGPREPEPAAPPVKESKSAPLALTVDSIVVKFSNFGFSDQTTAPAFETRLKNAEIQGKGLDLEKGGRSDWTLMAQSDAGETVKLSAAITTEALAAEGSADFAGVQLKRYQPYLNGAVDIALDDGRLDAAFAYHWNSAPADRQLKFTDVALALKSLRARLSGEKEPFLRVGSLQVKGALADINAQQVNLGEISVQDLSASARRGKDGALNFARLAKDRTGSEAKPRPDAKPAGPWRIDLARMSLERGALAFEDLALGEPVRFSVAPLQFKAERLSTAKGQRGTVDLRATIDKTGTLAASGPLSLEPFAARLDVNAQAIRFVPVQRYIDEKVHFGVTSGALSAKGRANIDLPPGGPFRASYQGDVGVADFASIDKRSTQDLLKWKALSLTGVDFELAPMRLALGEIALSDYYARIIVSPDGRLNLQDLVSSSTQAAGATSDTAESSKPPAPAEASKPPAAESGTKPQGLPPNVRIGKITLQGGNVNFSDFFVKPNYSANLTGIGGSVTEMTPDKAGDVDLSGKVDDAAPVEIAGRVNPLGGDLFLDMKASARDIELPPLTPYSVKYAGYGIQRGKLSLNVQYHIENRKLAAENQVILNQLTFGERVDSPTATKLPVTLAIALLKDRNGVIDINLPISGSLDDPDFSVGGIIIKVIVNLIVKAVTSPFALLGSMFGGGEELSFISFAPGSAAIPAGERSKLEKLAKALTERPGLKLDVTGQAAPNVDREGLKRASVLAKVKAEKFNDLRRSGTAPASVDVLTVEAGEYEKYLRRVYGNEKFDKPRNALGIARDLPVAEMESLMLGHTEVSDDGLRDLANARARTAKEWIEDEGKVPAERVFLIAPKIDGAEQEGGEKARKESAARVDFSLK